MSAEPELPLFSVAEAMAGRDDGIARAEAHANRAEPSWSYQADKMLWWYISEYSRGSEFLAEEVRTFAEKRGLPVPPDPRAWGGVMVRAAKRGAIVGAGFTESRNIQAHCRPTKVWRIR